MIEAEIGDELVALDVAEGQCFGFNGVATEVWRSLERPCSFTDLHDRLMVGYDVRAEECSADLRELIDQMLEMGLIRKENANANA